MRIPNCRWKKNYISIYIYKFIHTPKYIFIHTYTHISGSQDPSSSSDNLIALKFSHNILIFKYIIFPYNCMSEGESCQVTIWPSDSQCHTNIPTSDTGWCLYFLEIIAFTWEINSKQHPQQWRALFLLVYMVANVMNSGEKKGVT